MTTQDMDDVLARMCIGKVFYRTEMAAHRSANKAIAARGVPLRVYQCPACRGFHLTKNVGAL